MAVVLPVSLLVTFRLTGILPELPLETITVDAVGWNMSRPSDLSLVNETVKNFCADGSASVSLDVLSYTYYENAGFWLGFDVVRAMVSVNASVEEGFIESLAVSFLEVDGHAALDIDQNYDRIELVNLEVASIRDWSGLYFGGNAFFKAVSIGNRNMPTQNFFSHGCSMIKNDVNRQITLTLVATYYNGIARQEVTIPIQLKVIAA